MRIPSFVLPVLFSLASTAQTTFPTLMGETTDGTRVELPAACKGKAAIIAVAFGKKAEPLLAEWYGPAYLRFVAKHGLFAAGNDVQLYFVPMFVGLNKAAYEPSMKKLRKSADPDVAERVVFFKGESDPIIAALGMKEKDEPWFFVLDAEGRIIHRERGAFSEEKLDAMEEALME
jgi:hypothetical protein